MLLTEFYQVENIKSETLLDGIKDALGRIYIPLTDGKVQCYDGASNMVGAKTGVATLINEIEPPVGDSIKEMKITEACYDGASSMGGAKTGVTHL